MQNGDPETLALWRRLIDVSVEHFTGLYHKLAVSLRPEDVAGESRYNDGLAQPSGPEAGGVCQRRA